MTLVDHRDDDHVSLQCANDVDILIAVVARVFEMTLDRADVAAVEELGSTEAARRLVHAPAAWKTSHESEWWQLVYVEDKVAGFVLPVTYDESHGSVGTIFHMGVLPDFRGRGLSRVLLRYTVHTLMRAGVERIFCDTAANNAPMIRAFEAEGWTRLADRDVPVPHHFMRVPDDH
jgi:ribosomal protein S18 acetylase RimI-like enzyme